MSTKHITAHSVHGQRRLKQYCEFQLCPLWFQLLQLHNEGDALSLVVMIQLVNFHKPFCMDYHSDILYYSHHQWHCYLTRRHVVVIGM